MVYKYAMPFNFDGFDTQMTIDVSAQMADARTGIWSLYDSNFVEILGALSVVDSTHVQVNITPAPASGTYMLVGIA